MEVEWTGSGRRRERGEGGRDQEGLRWVGREYSGRVVDPGGGGGVDGGGSEEGKEGE